MEKWWTMTHSLTHSGTSLVIYRVLLVRLWVYDVLVVEERVVIVVCLRALVGRVGHILVRRNETLTFYIHVAQLGRQLRAVLHLSVRHHTLVHLSGILDQLLPIYILLIHLNLLLSGNIWVVVEVRRRVANHQTRRDLLVNCSLTGKVVLIGLVLRLCPVVLCAHLLLLVAGDLASSWYSVAATVFLIKIIWLIGLLLALACSSQEPTAIRLELSRRV